MIHRCQNSLLHQPILHSIALSSPSSSRLKLYHFNLPKSHGGISVRGRSVRAGASVGEVGDVKFKRVLETLGRSRTLDALEERVDGNLGPSIAADWQSSERALECCEVGRKLNVAVLLSGGVDSSVALRLLCAAGHSCTAFYLKIWFQVRHISA